MEMKGKTEYLSRWLYLMLESSWNMLEIEIVKDCADIMAMALNVRLFIIHVYYMYILHTYCNSQYMHNWFKYVLY